jgi:hypothetical protein
VFYFLEIFATRVVPVILLIILALLVIGLFSRGYRKIIIAKAWPAFIAGLFAAFIIPLATEIYWKRQKDFEICIQDRAKRYELVGSTARTYSTLFKIHTRLDEMAREWAAEDRAIRKPAARKQVAAPAIHSAHLVALDALRSDLVKERIRLEGQLGADSALVAQYLPGVAKEYYEVGGLYDRRTSEQPTFLPTPAEQVVDRTFKLIALMAEEARTHECK